jgi:hypothetical protein
LAASVVSAFTLSIERNPIAWTPIAATLVHNAPDPIAVMRELVARFRPMAWSGSRSTILKDNARLLAQFDTRGNVALGAFIATQREDLETEARSELESETKSDKNRDERFEW